MNTQNIPTNNARPNGAIINGAGKLTLEQVIAAGKLKQGWDEGRIVRLYNNGQGKALDTIMAGIEVADAAGSPVTASPIAPVLEKSIQEQLAELRAENERLKAKAAGKANVSMKMSVAGTKMVDGKEQITKGGSLCVYGLGRFPINLSLNAVIALFGDPSKADSKPAVDVKAFAKANLDKFRTKE